MKIRKFNENNSLVKKLSPEYPEWIIGRVCIEPTKKEIFLLKELFKPFFPINVELERAETKYAFWYCLKSDKNEINFFRFEDDYWAISFIIRGEKTDIYICDGIDGVKELAEMKLKTI